METIGYSNESTVLIPALDIAKPDPIPEKENEDDQKEEAGCCQVSKSNTKCASYDYVGGKCIKLYKKSIGCGRALWVDKARLNTKTMRCEAQNVESDSESDSKPDDPKDDKDENKNPNNWNY